MIAQFGNLDDSSYVADAKGTYSIYVGEGLTFGVNKGDQVFETRCYDKSIRTLSQADLIKYLGKPDFDADSTTQTIIGYKVNGDYRLEFVSNTGFTVAKRSSN